MRAGQWKACAWHCVFRNVNIDLIRGKVGRVVVNVLNIYFDHADLLVVGEHLHGELALWVPLTQGFPVDALLRVQQSALGVHVDEMRSRVLQHPEVGFLTLSSRPNLFE
uniref:Uncharacterized protein n=1 Tax=Gasterosteus aculeatus aculeatus TaxID=481459 RepID=A0AAQ4R3A4_GASAC